MKNAVALFMFLFSLVSISQTKDLDLPIGNEAFGKKKYSEAESNYRISKSKNDQKAIPSYNLGTSIYKQKQISEAKYHFLEATKNAKSKIEKHRSFHNLGNCLYTEKDYSGAVEAYKNALRNNPNDEQTRYNYALAKQKLKENPVPPKKDGDKQDDPKEQKDKNKNDKNQKDKEKDNKGDQKDDKNNNNDKDKNKKGENPNPEQTPASKQRNESLLNAVNNEEKRVQEKVNGKKVQTNPNKPEKDW